jgi:uncharacterized repeat protein (TIGR02543 family)
VPKGGKAEKPADPALEGRALLGWRVSEAGGPAWDFAVDTVEEDITLHAWWENITLEAGHWALLFNSQGGAAVEPASVKHGERALKPVDPVRAGRVFAGWHKDAACKNPWDFAVDTVTAHTILYAKWSALNMTVHFDPRGGTPAPQDQSVPRGGRAAQPALAQKGFLLEGWHLSPEGGAAWDFALDTVEENITLHARWTELGAGQAAVTFDAAGGSPVPPPQPVALGGKAARPPTDPAQPGFEFDGWFENTGLAPWDFVADTVEEDITLYARWTAVYAVVIDPRNGGAVETLAVRSGSKAQKPADPSREEHHFAGWHSSITDTPWNFDGAVTSSMTLYAQWIPGWSLSFDSQGGSALEPLSVKHGERADKPADPVWAGRVFQGWHKDAACENPWDFAVDAVTAHTTLYAKWSALNLTVRFDPHGGTPAPQDQSVAQGGRATQPGVAKKGFLLEGWYTEAAYTDPWNFALDTVEENITLHARWTELGAGQAAVTFDARGGSPVPPPQPVALGGKAARPPTDPTQPGFEFDGWFENVGVAAPWNFEADRVEKDITLYAGWTAVYALVIDPRNGGAVETLAVRSGSKAQKPADPSREQHRFAGWYSSLTDTPWNFNGAVTGSMTLYAQWIPLWSVSFESQGGSPVAPIEAVDDGQTIDKPLDPIRENSAFSGWHSDAGHTKPWNFETGKVEKNLTLYAKWTALVRFDPNGGDAAPDDQIVTIGSLLTRPADPGMGGSSLVGWYRSLADDTPWDFASHKVTGDMTLYARWGLVFVERIDNVPVEGVANETLSLSAATAIPATAANKTILWSVKDPGTTGVAAIINNAFSPAAKGTLILTATIRGGKQDASGNAVDYTENFTIKITAIRKVTGINNVPAYGSTNIAVDLGGAAVIPANATNKTILWSVKDPGTTGVAAISGHSFKPASAGTLVLTAKIVNGDEAEAGLRDYTQDFTILVDTSAPVSGGVGMGADTTIKLYANAEPTPLSAAGATVVARNSAYYVRVLSEYTEVVWHLNGTRSTVSGNILYLDTGKSGVVKVTVEAKTMGGALDSGTHTFRIE